ncbi:Radical SAM, alpha/beta horseshoe [Syntrophomonas zehnderi OL-4]|uniref:Heme chaperone HemW n=2 Tax=Syntrophomonas TaxID=862 RepID=A0A0E4C9F9_9FIRM|nr:Radical SAM, alpha/beta horseshoe [Syntrophomonas zehnderi OL-4]
MLERYIHCLLKEIKLRSTQWKDYQFSTIYLGGGTPSLLEPFQIEQILKAIFHNYVLTTDTEISMEANPATVNLESLRGFREAGINRISLGVQSFQDNELKILGRIHRVSEIKDTLGALAKSGIKNINLDLIYGIPGQTWKDWLFNLRMAVKYHPQHISAYLLQLDPSVPLARRIISGEIPAENEDLQYAMYYSTIDYLSGQGYQHYEISNFALTGYECHHNLIYWQAHEYLGLGVGAVSYQNGQRIINKANLHDYLTRLESDGICDTKILETMNEREKMLDALILGLRMTTGIKPSELEVRFGIDFIQEYYAIIKKLEQDGLLIIEPDRIRISRRGYFLSNQVFSRFI